MATRPIPSRFGFLRIAAAVPELRVADPEYNLKQIVTLAKQADKLGASLTVFPELTLTGWSIGDLVQQEALLDATRQALVKLAEASKRFRTHVAVGLPLATRQGTFNVAAVVGQGTVHGLVPKTHLPNYQEFYEQRWYRSGRELSQETVTIGKQTVPIGTDLLFADAAHPELTLGIELCEDLWAPVPPSSYQTLGGAMVIANLSASNETVSKDAYRRQLISQQAARGHCAYVYCSAGVHESTTDLVFSGHALISENGVQLDETQRFSQQSELIATDIDLAYLQSERRRSTTFRADGTAVPAYRRVPVQLADTATDLRRTIDPHPFVPSNPADRDDRAAEVFAIQAAGLAKRLGHTRIDRPVIGVSGGLDSTLALLVAAEACRLRGIKPGKIMAITMPGLATGTQTRGNADRLAEALGIALEEVPINEGIQRHLAEIGHDGTTQDLTYENSQARYRTMILMNRANQIRGLVIGTGDLSELALGWNTFSGDQIAHYNVNAGLPKTLVRHVVDWASREPRFADAQQVLQDILATPISPELMKPKDGKTQETETIIGPYELHDFFLYHFVRRGSSPAKLRWLARQAFGKQYSDAELTKWLTMFVERFFKTQWKRSVMPDGPKVGSVTLSPRGDWRMPSDAEVTVWRQSLKDAAKGGSADG